MNMKIVIRALATCVVAVILLSVLGSANAQANTPSTAKTAGKPNIVHVVADDLGWKDVGFNGAKDIKTPNLDKLAAEGVKFAQFYVQPMCTPTRAALMTGRYPFRYGLQTSSNSFGIQLWLGHQRMVNAAMSQGSGLQHRNHWQVAPRSC